MRNYERKAVPPPPPTSLWQANGVCISEGDLMQLVPELVENVEPFCFADTWVVKAGKTALQFKPKTERRLDIAEK